MTAASIVFAWAGSVGEVCGCSVAHPFPLLYYF